jgi:voltage-gated potassium channel
MLNTLFHRAVTALSGKTWFPNVPLALGVAVLGLLHFIPVFDQMMAMYIHLRTPGRLQHELVGVSFSSIAQLSFSLFLLLISFGLWMRSRLAWLLAVLAAIGLISQTLQSGISVGVFSLLYNIVLLSLLFITRQYFTHRNIRHDTLSAMFALIVLFAYAVFGTYRLGNQFSPPIDTLTDAFYVSVVTITTVGFGDFSPATSEARLFVVSVIFFSVTVISTAVGATLIPALIHRIENTNLGKLSKMNRREHYIIIGFSALSANTYRELIDRNRNVTVILTSPEDRVNFSAADVDVVIGEGSNTETLIEAGAEHAKAILALLDDDSENAFVILTANELKVGAKTVAAVNEAKHLNRIRRVHPDMIIAPQVLGGELLTSILTGERIDVKDIMSHLLGQVGTNASSESQTSKKKV